MPPDDSHPATLENLIKAFQILLKYGNPTYPTDCQHDIMRVMVGSPDEVSDEDKAELDRLGFFVEEENHCFASHRYGST